MTNIYIYVSTSERYDQSVTNNKSPMWALLREAGGQWFYGTSRYVYISQATRPPFSPSSLGWDMLLSGADTLAETGASLTRRRVSGGSRHAPQSIRAHTAALRSVMAARAICTQAITTKSREDGLESSSSNPSLK
ncbi:unnamed protein product [Parnassius apollo]|uniref:(apollo) hypothetical protein n=1 Tax=Parnassius apollo TaxID=110799 RepID=A0A8S3Y6T7_PARAO|nr:unnamed protein product [Parnassius apollo]